MPLMKKATTELATAEVESLEIIDVEAIEDEVEGGGELEPFYSRYVIPDRVLPRWVTVADERRMAAEWLGRYAKYQAKRHSLGAPIYVFRVGMWAPIGAWRVAHWWADWAWDSETMRRSLAQPDAMAMEYLHLERMREDRARRRIRRTGIGVGASALPIGISSFLWPVTPYALLVVAAVALAMIGRPVDKAIIEKAVISSDIAPRLQPSHVLAALGALGIAEINKALGPNGDGITFAGDPYRDGPGWRVDVDLPLGVTAKDVIAKRSRLASGLRRNVGCVWPEADPDEHEGRLVLWVGDRPLRDLRMPEWPLLREGITDIFAALPFGVDVRGRPIPLSLIWQNLLIGAMPRQGKTFCLRSLLLAAGLDPIVQLLVHELKGTGDLAPLKKIAHRYSSGITTPAVKDAFDTLLYLEREIERRSELISDVAARNPAECPENKLTRAMCENPAYNLDVILAAIDEVQNLFIHPEYGQLAAEKAEHIIKVGPAMGVILLLATQKPNARSLPTNVTSQITYRFALRVADQPTNDMILGTSQHKNGNKATIFSKRDLGIGLLLGEEDDPQIVRCYYIDNVAAEEISQRALLLRQEHGRVTGVAAGQAAAVEVTEGLPEHLMAIWPGGAKVRSEELLPLLARQWPELYATWNVTDFGNACAAYRLGRVDVGRTRKGDKTTRKGIALADLEGVTRARQPV